MPRDKFELALHTHEGLFAGTLSPRADAGANGAAVSDAIDTLGAHLVDSAQDLHHIVSRLGAHE